MKVELTEREERIIESKMKTGRYKSPAEVVSAALGMISTKPESIEEMRAMIQEGVDDIKAGRVVDGKETFRKMDEQRRTFAEQQKRTA